MQLWHIVVGIVGVGVLGLLGFVALAWRPAIAPIEPPAKDSFPAEQVAKGKVMAGAGYCTVCHTGPHGPIFAGGYGLRTPFGTIYSTNITPDPDTGIGRWSEAAFARAMHEGVARDGSHLFPAFPYDHFTKVSDEDVQALYAYLMTRPPVRAAATTNTVPFPLNIRASPGRLENPVLQERPLSAGHVQECRVESRRVSGRRSQPLWRLPYAAKCAGR